MIPPASPPVQPAPLQAGDTTGFALVPVGFSPTGSFAYVVERASWGTGCAADLVLQDLATDARRVITTVEAPQCEALGDPWQALSTQRGAEVVAALEAARVVVSADLALAPAATAAWKASLVAGKPGACDYGRWVPLALDLTWTSGGAKRLADLGACRLPPEKPGEATLLGAIASPFEPRAAFVVALAPAYALEHEWVVAPVVVGGVWAAPADPPR